MNSGYLKWHLFKLRLSKVLIAIFVLCAVGCIWLGQSLTQYAYQQWTQPFDAYSMSAKLECYERAVALCPGNILAYERILETYLQDETITKAEFEDFQLLLNRNQSKIYASEDEAIAFYRKLINCILCAYDDVPEERLRNAHGYIEMVRTYDLNNNIADAELEMQNALASFYSNYVWSTVNVQKPTAAYIEALVKQIEEYATGCGATLTQPQLVTVSQIAALLQSQGELLSTYSSVDTLSDLVIKIASLVPPEAVTPEYQRPAMDFRQWKELMTFEEAAESE